jgi:threonine dehydrogenase-like Zn-dependent dehydrogenase
MVGGGVHGQVREMAERIGVKTVNPADENLEEIVMTTTQGRGMDVTFECAGAEATLNQAFTHTRSGGKISLIAHYRAAPRVNIEAVIVKSLNVFGPTYGNAFFNEAVKLLLEEAVDFEHLVSYRYPLEQAEAAFETASDVNQSVKALFTP